MTRVVLATQRVFEPDLHGATHEGHDVRWSKFLRACGLTMLPVPNDPEMATALAEDVNAVGVILTGGGDLLRYGGRCVERQATEDALVDHAERTGRPVFGVCRGMQYLLDRTGVALFEVTGHTGLRHRLGGHEYAGGRTVNSAHRFGARQVGPDWAVEAAAGDVIEAVRHTRHPWRGVMWHPEREAPFHGDDIAAFRSWFLDRL